MRAKPPSVARESIPTVSFAYSSGKLRWLRLYISAATLDFDKGAFCKAAVALAGVGDLLPA
jgi:hypothetical protein